MPRIHFTPGPPLSAEEARRLHGPPRNLEDMAVNVPPEQARAFMERLREIEAMGKGGCSHTEAEHEQG
ncbi:MAG: hypothetical protein WD848_04310 [Dehalococcoidia bacterium]